MSRERAPVNPATASQIGRAVPISELSNPMICSVLQIWREKSGEREFPPKHELLPKAIAPFLKNVMLIAMLPDGDFEFRVVGDAAVIAYGDNFQGMRRAQLNALEAGFGDVIARVCEAVGSRRAPLAVKGVVQRAESSADAHEGVFLPLGDQHKIDHVLFVGSYNALGASELAAL